MAYSHLTEQERTRFESLLQAGIPIPLIAAQLGRHKSTLYREKKRNGCPVGKGGKRRLKRVGAACLVADYIAVEAHSKAGDRASRTNTRPRIGVDTWLEALRLLQELDLSPRQIADQLAISHEHLYQWIYRQIKDGYVWEKHLRSGRRGRLRRKSRLAAAIRCATRAKPIAERPDYVNNRRHFGHWEADLLLGRKDCSAAVLVVKERMSRLTLLVKVPRKDSQTVMRAMLKLMRPYLACIYTMTTDNGKEFFHHQAFVEATGCTMFVCKPHAPWQRGQVEGENKNIRQYLPKSFNVDRLTTKRLKSVQRKLNLRPKRVLNNHNPMHVAFILSGVALRT